MSAKHTPGPWMAEHGADDYFYVADEDGLRFPRSDRDANARAIAAVPELIEALQNLLSEIGNQGRDGYYDGAIYYTEVDAARAALIKATGDAS